MNGWDQIKAIPSRVGMDSGKMRILSKSLVATACALSMAFYGCSAKGGKSAPKVVVPTDPNKTDVKAVVTAADALLNANKGKGKGVITGFLTGEGKSIATGLLKQASNAGGERRLLTKKEIPLTGATVLIFNALKPTTAPDTTLKTDSTGTYTCLLTEGKFFGFAVYLDLETFQLVTTSIPNMNPKADTVMKMDTATAIEDVTAPTVTGVYDASNANSDGIFLVGSIPDKGAKINITFSEAMNRESAKGVILGRIDTTNTSTSMVLADTVKNVAMSWSGDSKELTLSVAELSTGAQYGIILPVSLKDLAKNTLTKEFKATFVTVAAKALADVPFSVTSTIPEDKGSLKPIQNPGVSFSRPVEAFSILKNAKIEPAVTGYFEISGARAVFIHKDPFVVGKTYTVTFPNTVTDLSGQALAKDVSFSFTVKDFDGAAKSSTGKEKDVALVVESAFDAYVSGDVGRFGAAFHPNFRLYSDDGGIKSRTEFLDMISQDVGDRQAQAAGFLGPIFDNSAEACKDGGGANRWKVAAEGGTEADQLWVDAYVNPGQSPGVYALADKSNIARTDITWDPTGPRFTYKGKKYGFGPDMTKFHGPVNMDAAKNDMRFMGDLLKQTSTVVLDNVKLEAKSEFNVDPNVTISKSGDSAFLAVKMIDYRKYNRGNFGEHDLNCRTGLADTSFQILKFILVNDGTKWLVVTIISPSKETNKADFDKGVSAGDFKVKQILPINLVQPLKDSAMDKDGKVTFKFKGAASDSVGGYIVGIAEDPKFCFGRPPFGALIFVKASNTKGNEESFVMNSAGGLEGTNANMILRRAGDLRLPGWDRAMFENSITTLFDASKGFGGVYNWKVIAIRDTSAVQFLANGYSPDRYYGESDFGTARGYFACKNFPIGDAAFNQLQANQQTFVSTQPVMNNNGFSDMDLDGVPDAIEIKYKTDPKDRNSYPDFRVDTDGDGLADFLEAMLDPTGKDSLVYKKADAAGVKDELHKLVALGIVWQDTDGDGFPDDIEMMSGFNPNDPKNNPGTRARASAPVGVFAGKFQMGGNLYSISFKLFTDTSKNMMVAYSAYVDKDTLTDTVRTSFNELAGEVYVAITLPKNGPDAGRALLLRGHYDANTSLLMGPIDMITAVGKTSINFGGGPYVGQFAASGRGEDVSRYLPNNNGGNGMPGNNVVNNPATTGSAVSYRQPPAGVSEGSKLIFANDGLILINDFGDTVALVPNINFRGQPDGSFQFDGKVQVNTGSDYTLTDVGGIIMKSAEGWVLDGHLFQEILLAGVRKQIPGQINAKGAFADIKFEDGGKLPNPMPQFVTGAFKGWIAQDKTGAGFAAQPVTNLPICQSPTATNCQQPGTNTCDPTKGACTNPVNTCPAGQNCNGTTNPVNSFSKTFVGGVANFKMFLDKHGNKPGEFFNVQWGGHVYKVKYDSTGIMEAKAPACGQVILVPQLLTFTEATAANKAAYQSDSMAMQTMPNTIVEAIEDQFATGVPAWIDKVRDSYGNVVNGAFVIEMRPVPPDYGSATAQCQGMVTNPNPTCDPTKGNCTVTPCDPTRGNCPVVGCDPAKGNCPVTCDPAKGACPDPACDPAKATCSVPCDPTKGNCNVPCDPAKGNCGPATGGFQPALYNGALDAAKVALVNSKNMVGIVKDSSGNVAGTVEVDPATLMFDDVRKGMFVSMKNNPGSLFAFLASAGNQGQLLIKSNTPLVFPMPVQGPGNTVPPDTGKVVVDTTKPPFYKGPTENIRPLLSLKAFQVMVGGPNGLVSAKVNPETLRNDAGLTIVNDAGSDAKVYIFVGDKADPSKPMFTAAGDIVVMEKVAVAGP